MGLSGKIEMEVEIKSNADKFYNIFRKQVHQVPNISASNVHHVELHEGDFQTHGSIKTWKYTPADDGVKEGLKARTEFDDENKKVTFVGLDGDPMKKYKVFKASYQAIPNSSDQGSLVKLSIEYEKLNEDVPTPNKYLDFIGMVTKNMDEHLLKA